jgi:hypothetical protein
MTQTQTTTRAEINRDLRDGTKKMLTKLLKIDWLEIVGGLLTLWILILVPATFIGTEDGGVAGVLVMISWCLIGIAVLVVAIYRLWGPPE